MIEPIYVTFEQAKLLKEKGFDIKGNQAFGVLGHMEGIVKPEQWEVVEWLRVNHGIWISVDWSFSEKSPSRSVKWSFSISNIGNREKSVIIGIKLIWHNSPQEAYSEAFDYILNNLQ